MSKKDRKIIKEGFYYDYFYECADGEIIDDKGRNFKKGNRWCPPVYEDEIYTDEVCDAYINLCTTTLI